MRKYILGGAGLTIILFALTIISWTPTPTNFKRNALVTAEDTVYNDYINDIYKAANLSETGLNIAIFEKAVTGFYNLRNSGTVCADRSVLSIADFDQNSTKKRLWIIDLDKKKLILNTWVAHGQRSGDDKATHFSNVNDSFQSSIGFYVTGEVYNGQHGRSLRLDGMDEGFNSNARKRSIVVHGAEYVSQGTINALGRLGRSQGCPAVAPEFASIVINSIQGKTVLFINSSEQAYTSKYLDEHLAATMASELLRNTKPLDTTYIADTLLSRI